LKPALRRAVTSESIRREIEREISSAQFGGEWPLEAPQGISSPLGEESPQVKAFWFNVNAELIIYGATQPDARVTIGGQPVELRPVDLIAGRVARCAERLDVPLAPGFRREQPHHAVVGERAEGVDQGVDKITVVVAPPQQHHVDHLVGVFIDQLTAAVDQGVAEIFIDVIVVSHLHYDHPRFYAEPVRQAAYAFCGLTSGRAHCRVPPQSHYRASPRRR